MAATGTAHERALRARASSGRLALALFSFTLFLSAFLLFSVQPFFAKMVLPRLGGSPAVWSVAMVFFQSVLLLGYGYAHLLTKGFDLRAAALFHAVVLLLAFAALPIAIPAGWERPPEAMQSMWLLGLFAVAVGLPFFAVSANGPLLQAWFSRTGHPHSADPYFLYGASNIGSFASLILYVVLFEPFSTVPEQSAMWTAAFGLMAALVACSAAVALAGRRDARVAVPEESRPLIAPNAAARPLRWIVLGFVPSGLLVAVTAHVSTDVAAAPFLWIAPLALFLLTFVLAFRRRPLVSVEMLSALMPFGAAAAVAAIYLHSIVPVWASLPIHLGFYFLAAFFCHSLLMRLRPPAERLTSFYLWMSFGGVLGGIFASLLAPVLFDWIAEYLLLIIVALLLRPDLQRAPRSEVVTLTVMAAAVGALIVAVAGMGLADGLFTKPGLAFTIVALIGTGAIVQFRSQAAYVFCFLLIVPLAFLHSRVDGNLFMERTFFGVVKVADTLDGRFRVMTHGTTIHGAMRVRDDAGNIVAEAPEPLTYYHESGGIADAIQAMQERRGGAMEEVGAVGLGTGSAICHRKPGEAWTAFEIDATVVAAASDPKLFRFMPECGADVPVVVGDARITLGDVPDRTYDLLLIDAFTSDSIPVHLMTREAIRLYRAKLKADGLLVMHISNRYLELASVLAAIAKEEGLVIRTRRAGKGSKATDEAYVAPSHVAVLAAKEAGLGRLAADPDWKTPSARDTRPWSDNYSNIISALIRG